jgi:hypothetical protein
LCKGKEKEKEFSSDFWTGCQAFRPSVVDAPKMSSSVAFNNC